MTLIDAHIREVKSVLCANHYLDSISAKHPNIGYENEKLEKALPRKIYSKTIRQDRSYDRIVAGYYTKEGLLYYLEKVKGEYVLVKYWETNETKFVLGGRYRKMFAKPMDFYEFKRLCEKLDFEEGRMGV